MGCGSSTASDGVPRVYEIDGAFEDLSGGDATTCAEPAPSRAALHTALKWLTVLGSLSRRTGALRRLRFRAFLHVWALCCPRHAGHEPMYVSNVEARLKPGAILVGGKVNSPREKCGGIQRSNPYLYCTY